MISGCRISFRLIVFSALLVPLGVFADEERDESHLLSGTRQLTFEGKRSGEGYFGANGARMVFQSERQADNPFYQIFLMDLEMGDVTRISPGHGKTTCAWIHPNEPKVLFASTHNDPQARKEQQDELDFRASGQTRRYSWDYDEHFELYEFGVDGKPIRQLTDALGYDAEGSWSPDGTQIAFASNRTAYSAPMSAKDQEMFDLDPAYMMEIYIMDADGSNVRQLTDVRGYDGGPFFSPDGKKITWRRFAENGATAEVYTMNTDGSDQTPLTRIEAMSWAPYYHPSGDYVIFTTNKHGFANFELYLVDAKGKHEPVRVTYTDGFDGLPVFTPDGKGLAWTTNRTAAGASQIFTAAWNDEAARKLLELDKESEPIELIDAPDLTKTSSAITTEDMRLHLEYLASDAMEGRLTGTLGEKKATQYVAHVFEALDLHPAGDDGTFFEEFEFTAGVRLTDDNSLSLTTEGESRALKAGEDWNPQSFSQSGTFDAAEVVFAGYGIKAAAPEDGSFDEYDSFVHLDVEDKWVMVFRSRPYEVENDVRNHWIPFSAPRDKARTVRDLGGKGILFISGPNSGVRNDLMGLNFDNAPGMSVGAVSITDEVAQSLLSKADQNLKELQDALDTGEPMMGFAIPDVSLEVQIDIAQEKRTGRNVLARLYASDKKGKSAVGVGAHVDHLGVGASSHSLAHKDEDNAVHYGADDNASGVAGVLEIAQYLAGLKEEGRLNLKRDLFFAAWSGEELGLLGVSHFAQNYEGIDEKESLHPHIAAYLNMDMIGRLTEKVLIGGVASSSIWPGEIERRNVPVGLSIEMQNDPYLPTDGQKLYVRGVPFLNAFTGVHEDYHSPRDTVDKINYEGAAQIAKFMALVGRSVAMSDEAPDYLEVSKPENMERRGAMEAYLGTIPDYVEGSVPGQKLSGVAKGGPADKAGLQAGDIIVELAGKKVENIYDYTAAIELLRIGKETMAVIIRDGQRLEISITPGARE